MAWCACDARLCWPCTQSPSLVLPLSTLTLHHENTPHCLVWAVCSACCALPNAGTSLPEAIQITQLQRSMESGFATCSEEELPQGHGPHKQPDPPHGPNSTNSARVPKQLPYYSDLARHHGRYKVGNR
eukprot:scaffold194058_cov20-Tisochrysis_lutea.AAC.1